MCVFGSGESGGRHGLSLPSTRPGWLAEGLSPTAFLHLNPHQRMTNTMRITLYDPQVSAAVYSQRRASNSD